MTFTAAGAKKSGSANAMLGGVTFAWNADVFARASMVAELPIEASVVFVTMATGTEPPMPAVPPMLTCPAMLSICSSSFAVTTTFPPANTAAPLPIRACVVIVWTCTLADPATPAVPPPPIEAATEIQSPPATARTETSPRV